MIRPCNTPIMTDNEHRTILQRTMVMTPSTRAVACWTEFKCNSTSDNLSLTRSSSGRCKLCSLKVRAVNNSGIADIALSDSYRDWSRALNRKEWFKS